MMATAHMIHMREMSLISPYSSVGYCPRLRGQMLSSSSVNTGVVLDKKGDLRSAFTLWLGAVGVVWTLLLGNRPRCTMSLNQEALSV